ncbi:MAG: ArnT family glycosyltransferase [Gammaproteobacteria bacterium]
MTGRTFVAACVALSLLSVLIGTVRLAMVPLDSHEIFVAGTAREMLARRDWIVPHFNGAPRLNKPPLSYWMTGAVAALAGAPPEVAAWHARAVSVLGGVLLLGATLATGVLVFERATAAVAGALLTTSAGMFSFMHDARPDLLYAGFTAVMLAGTAWSAYGRGPRARAFVGGAGLVWLAFACATLTKGPHVPALALLGIAMALRRERGNWRAVRTVLRPLGGITLAAVLCLPWWVLLDARLATIAVESTQLGGTLLAPRLSRLGDPYYLYRPLQLVLPWLPLAGFALAWWGWAGATRRALPSHAGFVLWPLLVVCLGLSLGRQYRYFYFLPLLGFLCLGAAVALRAAFTRWPRGALATLGLQAVAVVACAGWVVQHADSVRAGVLAWLAAGGVAAAVAVSRRYATPAWRVFAALCVAMAGVWPAAALTGALWNAERYGAHALAQTAAAALAPTTPLVALEVSGTIYVYYAGRPVQELADASRLAGLLAESPDGQLGLVTRDTRRADLDAEYIVEELGRYRRGDGDDVLLRLAPRAR